jgi:hypothetical protein
MKRQNVLALSFLLCVGAGCKTLRQDPCKQPRATTRETRHALAVKDARITTGEKQKATVDAQGQALFRMVVGTEISWHPRTRNTRFHENYNPEKTVSSGRFHGIVCTRSHGAKKKRIVQEFHIRIHFFWVAHPQEQVSPFIADEQGCWLPHAGRGALLSVLCLWAVSRPSFLPPVFFLVGFLLGGLESFSRGKAVRQAKTCRSKLLSDYDWLRYQEKQ